MYDQIKIKKIKGHKDSVKFEGQFAKYVNKRKNTILTTLTTLRAHKLINNYYSVVINKKIPTFAGLGGGTSNAVSLIKFFINKKINKYFLNIFEKKIGTDLRLFLYNKGFLINLKKVKSINKKYKFYFLLVCPNIRCSTKSIYSKIRKYSPKFQYSFNKINNKKKFVKHIMSKNNDLQSVVEKKYPIIRKILREIEEKKGCYFSRITGSGSVCYGMFNSETTAKAALVRIKSKYPKFWFLAAKTI